MRKTVNRLLVSLAATTMTSWLLAEGVAMAANPTTPECLAASSASLQSLADHKLRLERSQLLVCAAMSCPAVIRKECLSRAEGVNAQIPTIVFEVKNAGGNELAAVKVTMDGEVVADHLDGNALTLDPGSHKFTFEAAGRPLVARTFILHESEKGRREIIVVGTDGEVPAPALAQAPMPAAPSEPVAPVAPATIPAETHNDGGHGRKRKVLGLVVGGGGVAGLVVGGIFGGLALSSLSTANGECPSHSACSPKAISDRSTTLTYGNVSTVAFVAGGVLLAGGLTVYFTAPKDHTPFVGVQVVPGMVGLTGGF